MREIRYSHLSGWSTTNTFLRPEIDVSDRRAYPPLCEALAKEEIHTMFCGNAPWESWSAHDIFESMDGSAPACDGNAKLFIRKENGKIVEIGHAHRKHIESKLLYEKKHWFSTKRVWEHVFEITMYDAGIDALPCSVMQLLAQGGVKE